MRTTRITSRSDLYPRLIAMQKLAEAQNFAVYRVGGSSLPGKQRLICEMENWSPAEPTHVQALTEAYGEDFILHMDRSVLPLIWSGQQSRYAPDIGSLSPFINRLSGGILPFSGIAFPVRLGSAGNGFVLLTGRDLDPDAEAMIDLHGRAYQIIMDLLSLDERRVAASEALSEREIACLQLAGDGRISEEIAEKLGLSVHTVNAYLGSATIKLDSVNRIQAIAKAIRLGYIN